MESKGTHREFTANRSDTIIKTPKKENKHTDGCSNTCRQKYRAKKEAEKKLKHKSLRIEIQRMWNMKCVCDYIGNKWSHRNGNKRLKEKFGSHIRKTVNRLTTEDSYTWNIKHNMESAAV